MSKTEITEKNIQESYTKALKSAKKVGAIKEGSKVILTEVSKQSNEINLEVVSDDVSSCCAPEESTTLVQSLQLDQGQDQKISFGCIRLNDFLDNNLNSGDTVIDFGSGPGHDLFMAARIVGKSGKAIGIDFTDAMIEEARTVAKQEGLTQVEIVKASIDEVPLENNIADFIISNCVINLAFNKQRVFDEAFRLLKSGGTLIDADVISETPLNNEVQANDELWCSCVGGALTSEEYKGMLEKTGFVDIEIELGSKTNITFEAKDFGIYSGVILAKKP